MTTEEQTTPDEQSTESIKEKYLEFKTLKNQAEQMAHYGEEVVEKLSELVSARQAIEEIVQVSPGSDAFVPLATGIFIKAKIDQSDQFLVSVGADTATLKNKEQVLTILNAQIADLEQTHVQLQQNLAQVHGRLRTLMHYLQSRSVVEE